MRASSSSAEMASARISCSVRSENAFITRALAIFPWACGPVHGSSIDCRHGKRAGRLIGARHTQHERITIKRRNGLQADGKAALGEATRDIGGGLARHVEGIAEGRPVDPDLLS